MVCREAGTAPHSQYVFCVCPSFFSPFSCATRCFLSCESSWSWRMGLTWNCFWEMMFHHPGLSFLSWKWPENFGLLPSWQEMGKRNSREHDEFHVAAPHPWILIPLWASYVSLWLFGWHGELGIQLRWPCPPWVVPVVSVERGPCSSYWRLECSSWGSDVRSPAIWH